MTKLKVVCNGIALHHPRFSIFRDYRWSYPSKFSFVGCYFIAIIRMDNLHPDQEDGRRVRPEYTASQFVDMLLLLGEHGTAAEAAWEYRARWEGERANMPCARTINNAVLRLQETGSFFPRNIDAGRPPRVRDRHHDRVVAAFARDSTDSLRPVALQVGYSYSTAQRIMADDGQHAYHFQGVQELGKLNVKILLFL